MIFVSFETNCKGYEGSERYQQSFPFLMRVKKRHARVICFLRKGSGNKRYGNIKKYNSILTGVQTDYLRRIFQTNSILYIDSD